jgi:hypothetical protein
MRPAAFPLISIPSRAYLLQLIARYSYLQALNEAHANDVRLIARICLFYIATLKRH